MLALALASARLDCKREELQEALTALGWAGGALREPLDDRVTFLQGMIRLAKGVAEHAKTASNFAMCAAHIALEDVQAVACQTPKYNVHSWRQHARG